MPRRTTNGPDYHVPIRGFSQVVEAPASGRLLFVSGLPSRDERGEIVAVGDVAGQARQVLERMVGVLMDAIAVAPPVSPKTADLAPNSNPPSARAEP